MLEQETRHRAASGSTAPGDGLVTLVAVAFILPFFLVRVTIGRTVSASIPSRPVELAVLLSVTVLFLLNRRVDTVSARRFFSLLVGTMLVMLAYIGTDRPLQYGTRIEYVVAGLLGLATLISAGAVSEFFFRSDIFVKTFWRIGMASLAIAIAAYVYSDATGTVILTNISDSKGGLRLQGLLSEPSDWAAVLPGLLLISWRARRWLSLVAVCVGIVLSNSSSVLFVAAVVVAIYVTTVVPGGKLIYTARVAGALLLIVGVVTVAQTDPAPLLESGSGLKVTAGRLIDGLQHASLDDPSSQQNSRFANASQAIVDLRAEGLTWTGYGFESSKVYFGAKYPKSISSTGSDVLGIRPNSLWAESWFDFGAGGLVLALVLMTVTLAKLTRRPTLFPVLSGFVVASYFNSAGGPEQYKFVYLSVFVVLFGWGSAAGKLNSLPRRGEKGQD